MQKKKPQPSELDRLFHEVGTYRRGRDFKELLHFIKLFPKIAPYNAMLLHMQKPGSSFVATAYQWMTNHKRQIKAGARPLVILRPFGPVEFVFELSDTEGEEFIPEVIIDPYAATGEVSGERFARFVSKLQCDGIAYAEADYGPESAGFIQTTDSGRELCINGRKKDTWVKVVYDLVVNKNQTKVTKLATIAHELGHLYCGHLGAPYPEWWKDRSGMDRACEEFEAESVCWLVCERMGIENPSARYLSYYLDGRGEIPAISLEEVLKAAGMIESIFQGTKLPRKEIVTRTSMTEIVEE